MSTSFVLIGCDWKTTLEAAKEVCSVQKNASDDRVYYRLQMANKDDYALKKRLSLSRLASPMDSGKV